MSVRFQSFLFKFISYLIIRNQLRNIFGLCLNLGASRGRVLCYRFSLWLFSLRCMALFLRLNAQKHLFFERYFLWLLQQLYRCYLKKMLPSFFPYLWLDFRLGLISASNDDGSAKVSGQARSHWFMLLKILKYFGVGRSDSLRYFHRLRHLFSAIFGYSHFYFLFFRVLRGRCSSIFYRVYLYSTFNWLLSNRMLAKYSLLRSFVLNNLRNKLTYLRTRQGLFIVYSYNFSRLLITSRISFFKANYFQGFLSLGHFRMLLTPGLGCFIVYFKWLLPLIMSGQQYPEVSFYGTRTMLYCRQSKTFLDYLDTLNRKDHLALVPQSWDLLIAGLPNLRGGLEHSGFGKLHRLSQSSQGVFGFFINPLTRIGSKPYLITGLFSSLTAFWSYILSAGTVLFPLYPLLFASIAARIVQFYTVSFSSLFLPFYKINRDSVCFIFHGGSSVRLSLQRLFCFKIGGQSFHDFFVCSGGTAAFYPLLTCLPLIFPPRGSLPGGVAPRASSNFIFYLFKNVSLLYFLILSGLFSPKLLKVFNIYVSFLLTYLRLGKLRRRLTVLFMGSLLSKVRLRGGTP